MGMLRNNIWRVPKKPKKRQQKKRSVTMNALSLQYLEQIVPIDEKATEFEVDGLKAPQVLNQFLLSFNKKFNKKKPSYFFSTVRQPKYGEARNKYFPDEFKYDENWRAYLEDAFEALSYFKYNKEDAEWTPHGIYVGCGSGRCYREDSKEAQEWGVKCSPSDRTFMSGKNSGKSLAVYDLYKIIVFDNTSTNGVPRPMGVLSLEGYNEYGSKSFLRFTFKSRMIETDKGETSSGGIGKLLKRVKKDSTDESRFFAEIDSYLNTQVDLNSFFSVNFSKDWLIYNKIIDNDTFKDSYKDPKRSPSSSDCFKNMDLAKLVIALAKRAVPDKMKSVEEQSHGYTGEASESKFEVDNSVLNNIIHNWSFLQKQERIRDKNLKNFTKYFVYIPFGTNAKHGWLKLFYELQTTANGHTDKTLIDKQWLDEIDIESDEGINIGTVQASQDINEYVDEVSKKNRESRSIAIFDHDNQIGIVPVNVCTFSSSYGLIVGCE